MLKDEDICNFWLEQNIFEQCIEKNKFNKAYNHADGPPFATGEPHNGHVLTYYIKSSINHYFSDLGFYVNASKNLDCHGLPIEQITEKELGLKTTNEIIKYGIENYNKKCSEIVLRYADVWKKSLIKLGIWGDNTQCKTMDKNFMNSSWWVFSELYKKNRVYEGTKIMPYSTKCATSLSNFETQQNFQDKKDNSLFVKFILKNKFENYSDINLMVWTTTPWTLIANYALCVGSNIEYQLVELNDIQYICASNLLINIFPNNISDLKIIKTFKGLELIGLEYTPLFQFNKFINKFTIIADDYVKNESGTAIVHIAPAFGVDDLRICIENNIITKESKLFCPLDANGFVSSDIEELNGMFYKNYTPPKNNIKKDIPSNNIIKKKYYDKSCNKEHNKKVNSEDDIIKEEIINSVNQEINIQEEKINIEEINKDKIDLNSWVIYNLKLTNNFHSLKQIVHSYPFCWRSDTPLIYRSTSSWFIKIEDINDKLIEQNDKINWVPNAIGIKMKNWLSSSKDWGISRSRFWGTPIPIWKSDDGDIICVSSSYELEILANLPLNSITDMHREFIDKIEITSNGKIYRRINDIFDCWFESGSVPYGVLGKIGIVELLKNSLKGIEYDSNNEPFIMTINNIKYPILPVDFISEGGDQTRGWFYTMMVLSTSLFDIIPFKNVIVNGLILDVDGKKLSKRLKNYSDPLLIVSKYGSDALRLYLLGSQAVRADGLKFNENGVHDVLKDIIIPLSNSVVFFKEYTTLYFNTKKICPLFNLEKNSALITNPINLWIIVQYNHIKNNFNKYMKAYDLKSAVMLLYDIVSIFNNGYIKLGRKILKGKESDEEWTQSLSTMFYILNAIIIDFRSIMPFFCEIQYNNINTYLTNNKSLLLNTKISVLLVDKYNEIQLSNEQLMLANSFDIIYNIILNIHQLRGLNNLSLKKPIKSINLIIDKKIDDKYSIKYAQYLNFILDECNILDIKIISKNLVQINLDIKPIKALIYKAYGAAIKNTFDKLMLMDTLQLENIINDGNFDNWNFDYTMFNIKSDVKLINNNDLLTDIISKEFLFESNPIIILMDKFWDESNDQIYYWRLVATHIQKCRKESFVHPWDVIHAFWKKIPKYPLDTLEAVQYINQITQIEFTQYNNQNIFYSQDYPNLGIEILLSY